MSRKILIYTVFFEKLRNPCFFAKPTHLALKLKLKTCKVQSYRLKHRKGTG